jgi:hypothetical protein
MGCILVQEILYRIHAWVQIKTSQDLPKDLKPLSEEQHWLQLFYNSANSCFVC